MNNDYTDITVILDRSGSMSSIKQDMEGGLNQFLDEQKQVPGKCTASLFQFDTEYEAVFAGLNISDIPKVTLVPRGGTALLDALGRTITATGERFKNMIESERPSKVIFVVITDGEENSSREFSQATINAMIKQQREIYKWEFIFLGANQDAIQVGEKMGFATMDSMTYAANTGGVQAMYSSVSANVSRSRLGGQSANASFSMEDRAKQAQYGVKTS